MRVVCWKTANIKAENSPPQQRIFGSEMAVAPDEIIIQNKSHRSMREAF